MIRGVPKVKGKPSPDIYLAALRAIIETLDERKRRLSCRNAWCLSMEFRVLSQGEELA
jgi:hypothetical protein